MNQNGFDEKLKEKVDEWLRWDKDPKSRMEIEALVNDNNVSHLRKILLDRMTFGTAGLRGKMAAGYACMNELVIVQTAQGLLKYFEENLHQSLNSNGIVLGYDGRHNSKKFAELTATVFLNANYPVKLFSDLVPTPFVPFAITKWKCAGGVMVTASHNPKEDNGYKVYASNGCQIISPADKQIQTLILDNLRPWPRSWDTEIVKNNQLLYDPWKETVDSYMEILTKSIPATQIDTNRGTDLKFAYSAMHGVGYKYIVEAMKCAGLSVTPVIEQIDPDPEFPTVKFPNPEEGKSSLNLSFQTADFEGCDIILANDPDADRLAVAEKIDGVWKVFNGNEIGALLGAWLLKCYRLKNPHSDLSNVYMLASTVSSKMLRSMARSEGFNFVETLTGFKWMGNCSHDLIYGKGKEVIFAFEEAIGFMCGHAVLDKDGVSAAVHLSTLACHLYKSGGSLNQYLGQLYEKYGHHITNNSYFICHDGPTIKRVFNRLRSFNEIKDNYPKGILNDKYLISSVRDLTTGFDSSQSDKKAILPTSSSSQMITFEFENGLVVTLRTSGTEPKIKYYTELCAKPGESREDTEEVSKQMVNAIVDEFLQPEMNALIPKDD